MVHGRTLEWTVFIMLAVGAAACNDTNPAAPQILPPAPQPSQQPGTTADWTQVTDTVAFCDFPDCPGRDGFTVSRDGSFHSGGEDRTGSLSGEELAQLNTIMQRVVSQDLSGSPVCTSVAPLPGRSQVRIQVVLAAQGPVIPANITVYEDLAGQTCSRGDSGLADSLRDAMNSLTQKYADDGSPGEIGEPGHNGSGPN